MKGRNLIASRRRMWVCRACKLLAEVGGITDQKVADWHTPGHPEQSCGGLVEKLDSKTEARVYLKLCEAENVGTISQLERQVVYPIVVNGHKVGRYTADFRFLHDGTTRVVEVKGYANDRWPFRKKVIEAACGIEIEVWTKPREP